jgi:hypothetical protein
MPRLRVVRWLVGKAPTQVRVCLGCRVREYGLGSEGVVPPLVGGREPPVLCGEGQDAVDVLWGDEVVSDLDARAKVQHLNGEGGVRAKGGGGAGGGWGWR